MMVLSLDSIAGVLWRLSLVVVLLLIMRPWLRHWMGNRAVAFLWVPVVMRLLVPVPLEAPWGFGWASPEAENVAIPEAIKTTDDIQRRSVEAPARHELAAPIEGRALELSDICFALWAAGFFASGALLFMRQRRAGELVQQSQEKGAAMGEVRALYEELVVSIGGSRVALRVSEQVANPVLVGVFTPTILVPHGWEERFQTGEMRAMLLHELGHARRGDLLLQSLFAMAVCVHWFNPLAGWAARAARVDCELACDEWVLARLNREERVGYGKVLLKASQAISAMGGRRAEAAIGLAFPSEGKRVMRRRIEAIGEAVENVRQLRWPGVVGVAAFGCALMWIGTGCSGVTMPPASVAESSSEAIPIEEESRSDAIPAAPRKARGVTKRALNVNFKYFTLSRKDEALLQKLIGKTSNGFSVPLDYERTQEVGRFIKARPSNLLSAPSVNIREGRGIARVEIIKEFRYPREYTPDSYSPQGVMPATFETRNIGFRADFAWKKETAGIIKVNYEAEVVFRQGMISYRKGAVFYPDKAIAKTFSTHNILQFELEEAVPMPVSPVFQTYRMKSDETVFFPLYGVSQGIIFSMESKQEIAEPSMVDGGKAFLIPPGTVPKFSAPKIWVLMTMEAGTAKTP